jgi:hypothetical protein
MFLAIGIAPELVQLAYRIGDSTHKHYHPIEPLSGDRSRLPPRPRPERGDWHADLTHAALHCGLHHHLGGDVGLVAGGGHPLGY